MMSLAVAEIDVTNFVMNFEFLCNRDPSTEIIAVMKADAYGHGAVELSRALGKSTIIAVARVDEGILLRSNGIENTILVLGGCYSEEEYVISLDYNLDLVNHSFYQLEYSKKHGYPKYGRIWVKLDTGMNRYGFTSKELPIVFEHIESLHSSRNVVVLSHFSTADHIDLSFTHIQLERFDESVSHVNCYKSISNSAAFAKLPQARYDYSRLGLLLYGIYPCDESKKLLESKLNPVMTLRSRVVAIKTVKRGCSVSYGRRWTAKSQTNIAVVGLGYADGYPQNIPEGIPVLIDGRLYPIVGSICMDTMLIDIGMDKISVGTEVIFWGEGLPIEHVSSLTGIIQWELVSKLSKRVKRNYVGTLTETTK
jgi:alanine racemase